MQISLKNRTVIVDYENKDISPSESELLYLIIQLLLLMLRSTDQGSVYIDSQSFQKIKAQTKGKISKQTQQAVKDLLIKLNTKGKITKNEKISQNYD